MKVLVAGWVKNYLEGLQDDFPGVDFITGETNADMVKAAEGVEVAFGPVPREVFLGVESLRWIQSGSAGVEWMRNIPELADNGLPTAP